MAKRKGWIKFADPIAGYGYILDENAADASETTLFQIDDIAGGIDDIRPGAAVEFDLVEDDESRLHAKGVNVI